LRKETYLKLPLLFLLKNLKLLKLLFIGTFPSKRAIYAELFSFCDGAIFNKCAELKKSDLSSRDKVKNTFLFFMIFIEKNKGFARLVSREALSSDEQNVSDAVNQFFERLELSIKQMLAEDSNNLIAQPGISAQLIVTCLEGNVGRYIRSKFKDSPSNYIENVWELLSVNIFKK
jgi:TetR/AcrR family transcriptional regulator